MLKNKIFIGVIAAVLLIGVAVTLFLIKQSQDSRSRASTTPTPPVAIPTTPPAEVAQACATPATVANVSVNYPSCDGTQDCNFTQADCTWSALEDGSSYKVTITEVETQTKVKEETLAPAVVKTVFPINQGKTYKCDVAAVNTCGSIGVASSDELLCIVDAIISQTPTPTVAPTIAPTEAPTVPPAVVVTSTPIPTKTLPPIEQPGGPLATIGLFAGVLVAIIGGALLLIL